MKPLVKKILEAGLVDKHLARMFERWGQLEGGSENLVGTRQITQQTMHEFVEELEILLADDEIRETRFDVSVSKPPVELYCPTVGIFYAVEDMMGNYIVSPSVTLHRGSRIYQDVASTDKPHLTVLEVEPLYQGDTLVSYQVTTDK